MEAIISSETVSYFLPHHTDCILYSYLRDNLQPNKYIDYSFTLNIFRTCSLVNIAKTLISINRLFNVNPCFVYLFIFSSLFIEITTVTRGKLLRQIPSWAGPNLA